jgi:hypothetical protein
MRRISKKKEENFAQNMMKKLLSSKRKSLKRFKRKLKSLMAK